MKVHVDMTEKQIVGLLDSMSWDTKGANSNNHYEALRFAQTLVLDYARRSQNEGMLLPIGGVNATKMSKYQLSYEQIEIHANHRRCNVDDYGKGWFHQWINICRPVGWHTGVTPTGQFSYTVGLVELDDGQMTKASPTSIKFIDGDTDEEEQP